MGGKFVINTNRNLDTCCINGGAGVLTTGTDYIFELTNTTSTHWNILIKHSANPDTTGWKLIYTTGLEAAYQGFAESESSRYGDEDASQHASSLEGQPNYNAGPWTAWNHLGCDYAQDTQTDWHADKVSDQEWYNVAGAPGPGVC